ncbi:hypothetical protein SAMN05444008_105139 [Cnuella takakiae]|uniref:Uncharacterized protein n=1 Tax=Cnuella takakiae TaxID=1302690 RepID=A0A1M4ZAP6_9BACT|nr:hypothetical protein SAMN05444008_105139 [Cnuella takakiae]
MLLAQVGMHFNRTAPLIVLNICPLFLVEFIIERECRKGKILEMILPGCCPEDKERMHCFNGAISISNPCATYSISQERR